MRRRVPLGVAAAVGLAALVVALSVAAPALADPTTTAPSTTTTVAPPAPTTTAPPATPAGPNDPLYAEQWGLTRIHAPTAWQTSTGRGVLIGIVDTGADLGHQDLAAHIVASTNCVGSDGDPAQCHGNGQDDNGHGTHVAGIAAAITGNALGGAGAAPDARLLIAKALDSSGSGNVADVNAGIEWVVDHGAKVVNLSIGESNPLVTSVFGTSLETGIEYAWSKGAIPVLASGNSDFLGLGSAQYGNLDAVVVGALARNGQVASYSSPTGNAKWALLAPGGSADGVQADDILSTYWIAGKANQYGYLAGTSMAAPFVSGALALLLGSGLPPAQAVARLLATVDTSVPCGPGSTNCHGLLNAAAAVAGLTPATIAGAPTTTVAPPPTTGHPGPTTTIDPVPAPPTTAPGAAPAVMIPARPPGTAPPTTRPPARPKPRPTPTTRPKPAVAVSPVHHSSGSPSLVWFVVLAVVFSGLVGTGVLRVLRTVDPDVD